MDLWPKAEQKFYTFAKAQKLQITQEGKLKQASCSANLYRATNASMFSSLTETRYSARLTKKKMNEGT